jgi:hypothetical protein
MYVLPDACALAKSGAIVDEDAHGFAEAILQVL